jgi:hypothetical protein
MASRFDTGTARRWLFVVFGLISTGVAGCKVSVTDSQGRTTDYGPGAVSTDMASAKEFSESAPTAERLKALTALISAAPATTSCDDSSNAFIHAYRSIEVEKYRFNRFAVDPAQDESARKFLVECVSHGPEELVGPSMQGLGYHGSKDDAEIISRRVQEDGSGSLITYAASGLAYVCDPAAGAQLKMLLTRTTDERIVDTVRKSIETRAVICKAR